MASAISAHVGLRGGHGRENGLVIGRGAMSGFGGPRGPGIMLPVGWVTEGRVPSAWVAGEPTDRDIFFGWKMSGFLPHNPWSLWCTLVQVHRGLACDRSDPRGRGKVHLYWPVKPLWKKDSPKPGIQLDGQRGFIEPHRGVKRGPIFA